MVDLILTIIFATSIGVIIKLSEKRVTERLNMLFMNYVTAAFVSFFVWYFSGTEFELSTPSWILAPFAGFIFAFNFFLYIIAIKKRGVALPVTLMRLSAVVPVTASMLFFNESPSILQILGVVGALTAAVMMSLGIRGGELLTGFRDENKIMLAITSLALLFCFGLADLSMKLFEVYGLENEKPLFLAALFGFAALSVGTACIYKKIRPRAVDYVWGIVLGLPNLFASYFVVGALNELESYIVFPSVAAGSVMLIVLVAAFAFGERMEKMGIAGVAITLVSLVVINL